MFFVVFSQIPFEGLSWTEFFFEGLLLTVRALRAPMARIYFEDLLQLKTPPKVSYDYTALKTFSIALRPCNGLVSTKFFYDLKIYKVLFLESFLGSGNRSHSKFQICLLKVYGS